MTAICKFAILVLLLLAPTAAAVAPTFDETMAFWVPVTFWVVGVVYFLSLERPKIMAAGVCLIGIAASTMTNVTWTQAGSIVFLALAIVIEAMAGDRIYERLFPKNKTQ